MSEFTSGNMPGFTTKVESTEANVSWSGRGGQDMAVTRKVVISASATDSGNTPSTTLRGGVILALDDTSGKAYIYDPDATNGRQIPVGILEQPQDMLVEGVATDRFAQVLVHGMLKTSRIHGLDARAKKILSGRFLFDDDTNVTCNAIEPRGITRKSADYTVTAEDNGILFVASGAVAFTLPTKENGLSFRFIQTADANLVISGSSDIVHKGNAGASTITFSTSSQKIGSQVLVECIYTSDGTLQWVASNIGGTTATVA